MITSLLVSFSIYLTVVMLVGYVAYRYTRNLSDFVLGGRSLNGPVAALSAGASDMSAWLLMGLPGAAYLFGFNQIWLPIGLCVGAYFNWLIVAPRLRVYTEKVDALTIPAYLDKRFNDKSGIIRMLSALATLVFFAFYSASGLIGGAILLSHIFHIDYTQSLLLGTTIIMVYTLVGGFLAVSWTDFFQGSFMFICLLLVPAIAIQNMHGMDSVLTLVEQHNHTALNVTEQMTVLGLINLLAWGLGYFGQPHILVRFMAVRSIKDIPIARRICMLWMTLSMVGALIIGVLGIAYFPDYPVADHESIFIRFSKELFHPVISGCVLAAILSSIMCAIDSQMLASSSALTEDIYHAFLRRKATRKELMWAGRIAVGLMALVAIALAWTPGSHVLSMVSYAWAGLASSFAAPVAMSLFWRNMTREGAIAGIVSGMATALLWPAFLADIWPVYQIIPGIGVSALSIWVVSRFTQPSLEQQKTFDAVRHSS